jgi:putative iron-dependent peroxidase
MLEDMESQAGILGRPPRVGRHLTFDLRSGSDPRAAIENLRRAVPPASVVGFGAPLVNVLGWEIPGLRAFPGISGRGVHAPSTQHALWVFVREENNSDCFDTAQAAIAALGPDFVLDEEVGTFEYHGGHDQLGHDLSGYEDGTENPTGEQARAAGIVAQGPLAGSSFAAVQRWLHDLPHFSTYPPAQRDNLIGRRLDDNEELPDAPVSAHVQRAAQESYNPPAFMVRRSMPWSERGQHGLYFLAFGADLDRFERVLRRMLGCDDGVVDGLFAFTRPLTGGYYWCPPVEDGRLALPS